MRSLLVAASVVAASFIATAPSLKAAEVAPTEPVDSRLLTGVFPPDPEGVWRRIGQTDSTSQCIGDPVTPLCAIETLDACLARFVGELCQIASAHFLGGPYRFRPSDRKSDHGHYRIYRVVSVRLATAEDLRVSRPGINQRHVGDLLVDIEWQPCWKSGCITFSRPTTYTMRRLEGRWAVVDIHWPRW